MEKEKITIELIDKLSDLSQLSFSEDEKELLIGEVSGIIEMLDKCDNVSVDDNTLLSREWRIADLRDDEIGESLDGADVFKNAPMTKNGYFGVPKVVE